MSNKTRGGLRNPPGGRPALPPELRRVRCGFMSIPQWLADWLKEQPEAAGRIVEAALTNEYKLKPPKNETPE
jgi:hypothetical protein